MKTIKIKDFLRFVDINIAVEIDNHLYYDKDKLSELYGDIEMAGFYSLGKNKIAIFYDKSLKGNCMQ